ncbi:3'-5' exoribonuclease YhaM [Eubacterium plexicaudatum ASF492]|uniref:HD domain-containing protein n=1 Tax=Eubacterium plexicaudatum ASF492 TaxID=1235802 RepID=N2AWE7_9FIRM|nr:3'-5' exoribonuclease YhaM [Eubacterium plexicaudatum ASF492]
MRYIETLREGERINEIYLCKNKQPSVTKAGKPFVSLTMQDKTGTLDAKIWDPGSLGIDDFEKLDYLNVVGDVTSFQGSLQLNIKRIRKAQPGEYDPKEFLPVSRYDTDQMYAKLMEIIRRIENPYLKQLTMDFFGNTKFQEAFQFHSAAKTMHHGFVGGLLQHTLGVAKLCESYAAQYDILNRDLLVTAAVFHDVGKLKELSRFPENDYTDAGQLLGHIIIGAQMLTERIRQIPDFPKKLADELIHCILAHHGELEYGSPKKPALAEAVALSFADNMDAKMEALEEAFVNIPEGNTDWLGFHRSFESNIRKTSIL